MAALRDRDGSGGGLDIRPDAGALLLRSGLSLRHMRMIAALDDHGRVSAAAQVMNISQPAASRMVAEMEAVLDVRLLERLPRGSGVVVRDAALKLAPQNFGAVTPQDWARLAKENDGPDADGIFLSCTNTRQIEAIADIEQTLGKPVVNSNQAVLWGAVKRLRAKVPPLKPMPELGRLMAHLN